MIFKLFIMFLAAIPSLAMANQGHPNNNQLKTQASDDFLIHRPNIIIASLGDPFYSYLIKEEMKNKEAIDKLSRNEKRKREVLENFELGSLKFSGIYSISNKRYATVEDVSGKGYIVSTGNYIGKNNGKISKISKDFITINEKILDPRGDLKNVVTKIPMGSGHSDK